MAEQIQKTLKGNITSAAAYQQKYPIYDDELDKIDITQEEKELRCKLAALYRLMDFHGWTMNIFSHLTAKLSSEEHFLINPFGLLYHEVTASSLLKIDLEGEVIGQGSTDYGVNKAGWTLHSAVHAARPDIKCVVHLHTPAGGAVSCMKCGLLRCSQESLVIGDVAYHPYSGILVDEKERKLIAENLGPTTKVMILHNHGILVCGETVEEAYFLTYFLMLACETQVRLMSCGGLDNMIIIDEQTTKKVHEVIHEGQLRTKDKSAWQYGEMEFEAVMRMLDDMGLKTGYPYKKMIKSATEERDSKDKQEKE